MKKKKQTKQKRKKSGKIFSPLSHNKFINILLLIFLVGIILVTVLVAQQRTQIKQQAATVNQLNHFTAAFSIHDSFSTAAGAGVQSALNYGYNPKPGDSTSGGLKAANMTIIDQIPDKLIRQFQNDNNQSKLLSDLTNHLKEQQNNTQIVAYWMLDDWYENGSAKQALIEMTKLIHQYTPGKPTICGFSGNHSVWEDGKAENFSPEGCDMVAPYIYPDADGDWKMVKKLAEMTASFKKRGWDIKTHPLVGVPQSYGGANGYSVPTAEQVETQTKAFCEFGATGIIFYDFSTGKNPLNTPSILEGVKKGLDACKAIWGSAPSTAPVTTAPTQIPSPTSVTPTLVCIGPCGCGDCPTVSPTGIISTIPTDIPSTIPTSMPISEIPSTMPTDIVIPTEIPSIVPTGIGVPPGGGLPGGGIGGDFFQQLLEMIMGILRNMFGGLFR